jgi:hypothetical protein
MWIVTALISYMLYKSRVGGNEFNVQKHYYEQDK